MKNIATILLILTVFASCGPTAIHNKSLDIRGVWVDDKLTTTIDISDTLEMYDLVATIVHQEDYGFENLYLKITTLFPDGVESSSPLSLELSNSMGIWNGKCSGNLCSLSFNLQKDFKFKSVGSYTFTIEQYSRVDSLPGIENMTLSLYESQAE